jgi:RHS repeat-associated protein
MKRIIFSKLNLINEIRDIFSLIKTNFYFFIVLYGLPIDIIAQSYPGNAPYTNMIIDTPIPANGNIIADCAAIIDITVKPGLSSTTINPNSRLYINPNIQTPISYSSNPTLGFQNQVPNLDQTLDIGTIKGEANVNLVGAANYIIPFDLPQGTGGLTPEISLEYNSDNTQGTIGMGWNLNGLQIISRVEHNLNHKNYVAGVKGTNLDRFALNGNLMIPGTVASNGLDGTEYHTELENFDKVISHGGNGVNGPDWFEVLTKEGLTIEFGKTIDSKLKPNGSPSIFEWYINKIIDKHGNYVTFEYLIKNGNDIVLKNIKYSGNSNVTPQINATNQINFYYDLTGNTNFKSIAGYTIKQSSLLNRIDILVEGALYTKYLFTYNSRHNEDYLVKLELENSLGAKINPTIFQYEVSNQLANINSIGNINTFENYFCISDINGDGRQDIIKKGFAVTTNTGMECNISNANGANLTAPYSVNLNGYMSYFADFERNKGFILTGADFNSDGISDFLFVKITVDFMTLTPAITNGSSIEFTNPRTFYFDSWHVVGNWPIVPENLAIKLLDFNGDSFTDIFISYGSPDEINHHSEVWTIGQWNCNYCDPSDVKGLFSNFPDTKILFDKSSIAYTDSKVKADLVNIYTVDANNIVSYFGLTYNDITNQFESYPLSSFMDEHYIPNTDPWSKQDQSVCLGPRVEPNDHLGLFADYNGDGFTDLISSNTIHYSTGISSYFSGNTFSCNYIMEDPTDHVNYCATNYYLTRDLNSDGRDDIIEFNFFRNAAVTGIKISYSKGISFVDEYYEVPIIFDFPHYEIGFADFDGDGQDEIYWYKLSEINTPFYVMNITRNYQTSKLLAVYDGLNNKTSFSYCSSSNESMRTGNNETPLSQFGQHNSTSGLNRNIVKSLRQNNGIGGEFITEFRYDNPITNLRGDGFIGFQKTSVKKLNTSIETLTENTLNTSDILILYPISEKVYNSTLGFKISTNLYSITQLEGHFCNGSQCSYFLKREEIKFTNHLMGYVVTTNNTINNHGNTIFSSISYGLGLPQTETTTTFDMDPSHRNTVPYLPLSQSTKTILNGESNIILTNYTYNNNHQIETKMTNADNIAKKVTTTYSYFPVGLLKDVTVQASNALTTVNQFQYDPLFKYANTSINPLGQSSDISKHPIFDRAISFKNEALQIVSSTYDGWGRQVSYTAPNSNISNVIYEWVNQGDLSPLHPLNLSNVKCKISINVPGKATQENYFDEIGRVILTSKDGFSGDKIYKAYQYNNAGLIYKETNNYQLVNNNSGLTPIIKSYIYDSYNRPIDIFEDDGINTPKHTSFDYLYSYGNQTVKTTNPDGSIKSIKIDAAGRKVSAQDDFGTIHFTYQLNTASNTSKRSNNYGITITFDETGDTVKLEEPIGITDFIYNGLGQLISKTDPKNANYIYTYDLLGRLNTITGSEGTYTYNYFTTGNGKNKIESMQGPGNTTIAYTYDNQHRIKTLTESQPNHSFITQYEYDQFDEVKKITYPGGFAIDQVYNNYGYLQQINRSDNQALIWQGNEQTPNGSFYNFTLGNNKTTEIVFTNFGLEYSKEIIGVESVTTNFDYLSGNLSNRSNNLTNYTENFIYNQNRLFGFNHSLSASNAFDSPSDARGRFETKFDAGEYSYYGNGALKNIDPITATVPTLLRFQELTNTSFNKLETVSEQINATDNIQLTVYYGPDLERVKGIWSKNGGSPYRTRYYAQNYEITEKLNNSTSTNDVYEASYIYSPTGLCAIFVKENGIENMNYVYTDYLGSINKIYSEATNSIVLDRNYDAWGRERNAVTLAYEHASNCPEWLSRGYEGHEMLNDFELINMNGRVYDPVIGQFLSPDPVLQDENNTLNYNKFAFVFNNPLKYIDPSGKIVEDYGINSYSYQDGWENKNGTWTFNPDPNVGQSTFDAPSAEGYSTIHGYADGTQSKTFNFFIKYGYSDGGGGGGYNWNLTADIIGVIGTGLKATELSSYSEAKSFVTKYGAYKNTGRIKGVVSSATMTRYGKISAASSGNLAKSLGTKLGIIGGVVSIFDAAQDGVFTKGEYFKIGFSFFTMVPYVGAAIGVIDLSVKLTTGQGISDRIGSYIDK